MRVGQPTLKPRGYPRASGDVAQALAHSAFPAFTYRLCTHAFAMCMVIINYKRNYNFINCVTSVKNVPGCFLFTSMTFTLARAQRPGYVQTQLTGAGPALQLNTVSNAAPLRLLQGLWGQILSLAARNSPWTSTSSISAG